MHLMKHTLLVAAALLLGAPIAMAQTPPTTAPAAEDNYAERLGEPFSSRAAGVAFRPPGGGVMARRSGFGTEIVQYGSPEEQWGLKVSRLIFHKPVRLLAGPAADPQAPGETGVLDEAAAQLRLRNAATQVLVKDAINVGPHNVGLLICRYVEGGKQWLRQQAYFEANDQLYYIFDFTTVSGRPIGSKEGNEDDPAERMAAGVFRAMLDSVQLIDQRPILDDNRNRLLNTNVLQPNLPNRIRKAVIPEQFFRVIHDGKDIGWSYIAEEAGQYENKEGFFVGISYHAEPEKGMSIEIASEMFCNLDLRKADEFWVSVNTIERDGRKQSVTETGRSGRRLRPVAPPPGSPKDAPPTLSEQYNLTVVHADPTGSKTIARDLPLFWYLPQATGSMLPRLLPFNEPKGYLYTTWMGGEQELIFRYMDVERIQEVTFAGRTLDAAVIKDRMGLEGEPTLHYIGLDGKYIGSYTPSSKLMILATDSQTLLKLWPHAKLARPALLNALIPEKK